MLPARAQLRAEMEIRKRIKPLVNGDYPLALDLAYLPAMRTLALLNEFIAPDSQTQTSADAK